jgi:hypothetical protein
MRKADITVFKHNDFEFWLEPKFLFISERHYHFRELADGGFVIWMVNSDNEKEDVQFLEHHFEVVRKLNAFIFEKLVLDEKG